MMPPLNRSAESLVSDSVSEPVAASSWRRWAQIAVEVALVFGVFFAYGAWPIPDVNEQYYVGKAIHFWNPEWLAADPFLNSPDSHWLFYAAFGTLSFFFSQNALVWAGRILIWALTACAWVRLSRALIPRRWVAPLTAAAFAFYLESFHMAGEWIFGGVEGKGFAFPFVFWGLACFVEGKYNRAWILYGIGAAFHVLVGGWAVVASLGAWAIAAHFDFNATLKNGGASGGENGETSAKLSFGVRLNRRLRGFGAAFWKTLPGLLVGGAISLIGVIPALKLDAGATADVLARSREIYVFERLAHHLVASSLPWTFLLRFSLLTAAFVAAVGGTAALVRRSRKLEAAESVENKDVQQNDAANPASEEASRRFLRATAFVGVAILIACVGLVLDFGSKRVANPETANSAVAVVYRSVAETFGLVDRFDDPRAAAGWLRYYWFRLSDWAVPFGLVFVVAWSLSLFWRRFERRSVDGAASGRSFGAVVERRIATALGWAAVGGLTYWLFRSGFEETARTLAAANAIPGTIPLPKPTEDVSFAATVVAFSGVLAASALVAAAFGAFRREKTGASGSENDGEIGANVAPISVCGRRTARVVATGWAFWCVVLFLVAPTWRLATFVNLRGTHVIPRSAPPKESIADGWLDVCRWAREATSPDAVFLVPRGCDSFKWEAQRAEVGSWKEIPQDANSIVRWFRDMERLYATPGTKRDSATRWTSPLVCVFAMRGRDQILKQSAEMGYQFAILETPPYVLIAYPELMKNLEAFWEADEVYRNDQYIVLRLDKTAEIKETRKTAAEKGNATAPDSAE
ncbi:MAG: hypothetical protein J6K25_13300 [Thermoguttaceae bacterium]|nr:hypothetical protein [Thermoguttaceae bacterium]